MPDNWEDGLPTPASELGRRLAEVAKVIGNQAKAAGLMGVSLSQFKRYVTGENQPTFEAVANLGHKAGMDLDWLAFGRGAMLSGKTETQPSTPSHIELDEELNARVVDGISRLYKEERVGLAPMDLGRLAARMYADLVNACDDPNDRPGALKFALEQLRRQLRAAPGEQSETKRLA